MPPSSGLRAGRRGPSSLWWHAGAVETPKDTPRPRYRQIADEIRRGIADGTYPPGTPLPSEESLAREFGVTRPTVRHGIAELRGEGVLVVHMGRGMFVQDPELVALRRERDVAWEMAAREARRAERAGETARRLLALAEELEAEGRGDVSARIRDVLAE